MTTLALLAILCCVALAKDVGSPVASFDSSKDVEAYWTPERLASAIPMEATLVPGKQNFTKSIPTGPGVFMKSYEGDDGGNMHSPAAARGENVGANTMYPFPYTSAYAPSYTTYPWRAVGKVFFTQGTTNYVCSGATVTQYMIFTAGHCVFSQSLNSWSTNFLFVPGYYNGVEPYGAFPAYQLWARTEYTVNHNEAFDFGIAVIELSGTSGVGNVVGWFGAAWNWGYTLSWRALGYPQETPFNGAWDYYCDAALGVQDTSLSPNSIGIGCDTTGGASGGPWVWQWGTNNYINSVNAYKYINPPQPLAIYGPYFGTEAGSLYTTASAVVPPF